jgi:hypothetical protein
MNTHNQLEEYRRRQRSNWTHDEPPARQPPTQIEPDTTQTMSDEELARSLQEQFDIEAAQMRTEYQQRQQEEAIHRQRQQQQRDDHLDQRTNVESRRLANVFGERPRIPTMNDNRQYEQRNTPSSRPNIFGRLPEEFSFQPRLHFNDFMDDHDDIEHFFQSGFQPQPHLPPNPFINMGLGIPFPQFPNRHNYEYDDDYSDEGESPSYEDLLALQERIGFVPKGASQQEIESNSLKYTINNQSQISQESKDCVVCMDEFKVGAEVRRLPCLHTFHADCIDQWLKTNKTCPICKSEVKVN